MPNFSGIWTVTQQMQAKGASTWPATPGAPTIGTATAGGSNCASVTFSAPACAGYPASITGYRVISTPGCFSNTGASSPVVVSGLTNGSSYTFKAQATNTSGYGALSASSNSITAAIVTCATYTTAGTYSWVAPAGVTSVAVVAVGGGGTGWYSGGGPCFNFTAGAGGGLGYKNAQTVTPGTSYTVAVGAAGCYPYGSGGTSYFISTCVVRGGGGSGSGGAGGTYTGTGGGNGGAGQTQFLQGGVGGAGAGGYSGSGGIGGYGGAGSASGSGGGGGGGYGNCGSTAAGAGAGGGVGLYGVGCSGAAGTISSKGGKGGSGGGNGGVGCSTSGGAYGGGGGIWSTSSTGIALSFGSKGAVRIVWAGGSRGTPSFPSTNVGA